MEDKLIRPLRWYILYLAYQIFAYPHLYALFKEKQAVDKVAQQVDIVVFILLVVIPLVSALAIGFKGRLKSIAHYTGNTFLSLFALLLVWNLASGIIKFHYHAIVETTIGFVAALVLSILIGTIFFLYQWVLWGGICKIFTQLFGLVDKEWAQKTKAFFQRQVEYTQNKQQTFWGMVWAGAQITSTFIFFVTMLDLLLH